MDLIIKTMKTNPNDSINPIIFPDGSGEGGITKREYFAALFIQGLLSNGKLLIQDRDLISELSIKQADSLIEKLNK